MGVVFLAEPGSPSAPECASRDRSHIELKWSPPRNDGGNPIKGYIVERREKNAKKQEWAKLNRGEMQKVHEVYESPWERAEKN